MSVLPASQNTVVFLTVKNGGEAETKLRTRQRAGPSESSPAEPCSSHIGCTSSRADRADRKERVYNLQSFLEE